MKINRIRRFAAAVMIAALLTGTIPPARASEALGHDLAAASALLSEGTSLASGAFWSDTYSDLRRENYVVYSPNSRVKPLVSCGAYTRELVTVENAAYSLEAQGLRVVAGINGDYYGTQHGVPLGSVMTGGELRNMNGDVYNAVGFLPDGAAVFGDPMLSMQVSVNGGEGFPVFAYNHIRQSGYGIFLYDSRFNDRGTTETNEPGVDVLCSVESGVL
ncbi:MAG: surface layer protein, partial [Oscillospiraceae bacterium]|nr:surface layer protein [Oscillospiraceae bacterium]